MGFIPEAELDEAITWFLRRTPVSKKELAAMRENAKRQAFWMAKVATKQRAAKIQASLRDALAHGMDFETWVSTNKNILKRIPIHHLETTFRNWTQTAYNAARVDYLSNPQVIKRRPYWVFDAILDGRTTPVCTAYDGTVLPAKHPWFLAHTPPLHHNCRSTIRGVTQKQAEKIGIRKNAPTSKLTKKQVKKTDSDLEPQSVSPQEGFGVAAVRPWQPSTRDFPAGFKPDPRPEPVK